MVRRGPAWWRGARAWRMGHGAADGRGRRGERGGRVRARLGRAGLQRAQADLDAGSRGGVQRVGTDEMVAAAPEQADRPTSPDRIRQAEPKRPDAPDLSRTERQILRLYYYEGMAPKEIGTVVGLSEWQVSRTHSAVLERLRATLGTAQD